MSEWITDRRPTYHDAYYGTSDHGIVWITDCGDVETALYQDVAFGTPWMPITAPEPYVKPKRFNVKEQAYGIGPNRYSAQGYAVFESVRLVASCIPTREAAERIAAIYEETPP